MQKIALIIATLISGLLTAQTDYEIGMSKANELWRSDQPEKAVQMYERIAAAEDDKWLPNYYAAYIHVVTSFNKTDVNVIKSKLEKAQSFLDKGIALAPQNPELMVIQALLYTVWIDYDGASYGMMYSGKVSSIYNQASGMAPDNPRVVLSKAEWDMGSARYFGKDIKPYCDDVERARELFATFKPESEFHPNWGVDRVDQILKNCQE
ncbi:MAG: hypothetical protein KJN68_01185 [Bacteroidia bacterium]|nr:hypothetical protein [Bacteroidia bacterium]